MRRRDFLLAAAAAPWTAIALADGALTNLVHVVDGDTVHTFDGRHRRTVRIAAIDAPELAQPFGQEAHNALATLCLHREVLVRTAKTDPYGRLVGTISMGDLDVGLAQVRAGLAWHFKRYAKEQSPLDRALYADAEMDARRRRVGLWAEPAPVAPWDFRSRARPLAHAP